MAFRAERVNQTIVNGWRRARTGRVRNGIRTIVFLLPQLLAIVRAQTQDALCTRNALVWPMREKRFIVILRAFGQGSVHDIDLAVDHGWAGVTGIDRHSPAHLWPAFGELLDYAGLTPNAIALWSHPLRPVVGAS